MNPVALRRVGIVALVLALVSLWAIAVISQRNWEDFENSTAQANRTSRVLNLNDTLLGRIRDAEAGQRGYLLTGQQHYLDSYQSAAASVPSEISELVRFTISGSVQRLRAEELRAAAAAMLDDLRHTIEVRKTEGLQAAIEIVERGRGASLMQEILKLSHEIEQEEYRSWSNSNQAAQIHADEARRVTIVGVVILGFLLIAAFFATQSSSRQRERLLAEVGEAHRSATEVRDLLRTTFYSIADAVITMDREGKVRLMNSVAERLTGVGESEARGHAIEKIFRTAAGEADPGYHPARKALAGGTVQTPAESLTVVSTSGVETPADVSAAPIRDERGEIRGCVLVFRDISERKRHEERMRDAAKLESLGVLAGGIAHDFNNLLVGIIGNASLLKEDLQENPFALQLLENVERAGDRAAQLTRQMLAYSGRGQFVVTPLDLSKEVEQITALLHASIPKSVELRLALSPELPPVLADAAQMQQLVMNLVINAAEAVEGERGWVEVATCVETVGEESRIRMVPEDNLQPGGYVVLRVTDNGVGMDESTKSKIFDPFFTTKFTGRGLGLAAVLGIVKGHRGGIHVESAPGEGTTFRVFLPAAAAAEPSHQAARQALS